MERQLAEPTQAQSPSENAPEAADDNDQGAGDANPQAVGQPAATPPADDRLTKLEQELAEYRKRDQERQETERAANLQYLNQQQQQEFQELETDVEAAKQLAAYNQQQLEQLTAEYQTAVAERDYETAESLGQAYQMAQYQANVSARNAQRLERQREQFKTYNANQYHQQLVREQANQIGRIASQYGLTPDDIKAVKADLDVTKPFEVLDVVTKALHTKLSKEVKGKDQALKEQEGKLRSEYRDQFDNSAGAQPHPNGSSNTSSGNTGGIRVGNSRELLRKAWGIK